MIEAERKANGERVIVVCVRAGICGLPEWGHEGEAKEYR